jgi:isopentenyldiphosphate isomerase
VARPAPADEPVEVVDPDGTVVAVVSRARMRAENLRHRAVFVLVQDTAGRVLVHRRSDQKDLWPGWWDLAVGGVVAAGESWDDAARRELAEELGVEVAEPSRAGGGSYEDHQVRLVARLYRLVHDGPFRFADGEVVEARFVTTGELRRLVAAEPFLPDSVALVLPLVPA